MCYTDMNIIVISDIISCKDRYKGKASDCLRKLCSSRNIQFVNHSNKDVGVHVKLWRVRLKF